MNVSPHQYQIKLWASNTLTGKGTDMTPRILHSSSSTRPWSTEAGDVGAATRGRYDAVASAPGVVVVYLGT